jgi:hypothetical protein
MVGCIKNNAESLYHSNLFRKETEKWTAVNVCHVSSLTSGLPLIEFGQIKFVRPPPRLRLMNLLA